MIERRVLGDLHVDPADFVRPLPDADKHAAFAAQLVQDDREQARKLLKISAPLLAVSAASAIGMMSIDTTPSQAVDTSSCTGFSPDVLKSPTQDTFGVADRGQELNPKLVNTKGMEHVTDHTKADGSPVLAKVGAKISNKNGKLTSSEVDMPHDYARAMQGILENKALRWGICQLDGGVKVTFTDTPAYENGKFTPKDDAFEARLVAGNNEPHDYPDQRALTYLVAHENGHALRQAVVDTNAQPAITALYKELGEVYGTHLEKVFEEYRQQHGKDLAGTIDVLSKQLNALDDAHMDASSKDKYNRAAAYLKQQLDKSGGLKDLAVMHQPSETNPAGPGLVSAANLNQLIANASAKVDPEDFLYGVDEFITDSGGKVDYGLLTKSTLDIGTYLDHRFPSEKVFEGDNGGHPDSDDELGAELMVLTGLSDASKDGRIIERVPDAYKADAQHELTIARKIREEIDPTLFAKTSTATSPEAPSLTVPN